MHPEIRDGAASMILFLNHEFSTSHCQLWQSDARDLLESLPRASADLIVTSPPYFIGKEYDTSQKVRDFSREIARVVPSMLRCLKSGGSICWQVGNHVDNGVLTPLDLIVAQVLAKYKGLILRNRIIWAFGHGAHSSRRFSGRHETILWYTKGDNYLFDLDSVRVPQRYPGKKHYKGPKKGDWSGHPLGKNPGDVWPAGDVWHIPNVKANHVEKTAHPCQFPSALVRRLVLALSPSTGLVVDPYLGSGTTAIAALLEGRKFIGGDLEKKYLDIAKERICLLERGDLKFREDIPIMMPNGNESVSKRPSHFTPMKGTING